MTSWPSLCRYCSRVESKLHAFIMLPDQSCIYGGVRVCRPQRVPANQHINIETHWTTYQVENFDDERVFLLAIVMTTFLQFVVFSALFGESDPQVFFYGCVFSRMCCQSAWRSRLKVPSQS